MKFDAPAGPNPIDRLRVVGKPHDRIEGPLKVTGRARYAYERHDVAPDVAYGYVLGASIARGRIEKLDTTAAEKAPGVIGVVTAENAGKLGKGHFNTAPLLGGPDIAHYHQAIAMVVARTFEQARAAAALIEVAHAPGQGRFSLQRAQGAREPQDNPDVVVGDVEQALATAEVTLDQTYSTPDQSHCAMEPQATLARWDGGNLTVWTSNQMIAWAKNDLAQTLRIPPERVRVVSPFIGGGFGGKLFLRADVVLAALGAKLFGRPVKTALQRQLIPNNTTHRPATLQRIRLGADRDGNLTAISHESLSGDQPGGQPELAVQQSQFLYAAPARRLALRLVELDLPEGNAMRAPGEAPGMMALEIAMDEMAEKLGLDPIDFRIRNDTQVDPTAPERRFSQRQLARCLQEGAKIFGWDQRKPPRAQKKEGGKLLGMGVAAGFRNNLTMKSGARVTLDAQGALLVETDMTDIGTGSYTIIAQTAAEMLGLPLEKVRVRLGDSNLPASSGSGGQWGGNSATAGVYAACVKLREAVAQKIGVNGDDAVFEHGFARAHGREISLAAAAGQGDLTGEDTIEFAKLQKTFQQSTFAGHFAEVEVDAATCEIRVRRALAVCAAGRVLNPKTARSQVIGAMTMGLGAALMEELAVDEKRGFFPNHDLALYEVPVHADIRAQEVVFLDETDPVSSPMKAKGVGELGICGAAAAIANAVHNATGVRVRDYPVTLDKLIGQLPPP
jgi:xanthine dehydrogenase YagR molybdenum-binding subunit